MVTKGLLSMTTWKRIILKFSRFLLITISFTEEAFLTDKG